MKKNFGFKRERAMRHYTKKPKKTSLDSGEAAKGSKRGLEFKFFITKCWY